MVEPKPKAEVNAERKSSAPAITGDAAAGTSGVPIGTGATGLDKDTGPKMGTKVGYRRSSGGGGGLPYKSSMLL